MSGSCRIPRTVCRRASHRSCTPRGRRARCLGRSGRQLTDTARPYGRSAGGYQRHRPGSVCVRSGVPAQAHRGCSGVTSVLRECDGLDGVKKIYTLLALAAIAQPAALARLSQHLALFAPEIGAEWCRRALHSVVSPQTEQIQLRGNMTISPTARNLLYTGHIMNHGGSR